MRITTKTLPLVLLCWCVVVSAEVACGDELAQKFAHPPADARPWVYWFWNNGNVTSNGITADLEAMQRVGIGGVLIMDVVERFAPPRGTADFMNEGWRNLFQFSVQEAAPALRSTWPTVLVGAGAAARGSRRSFRCRCS